MEQIKSYGGDASPAEGQKPNMLAELCNRIQGAANEITDVANDLHRQADRVFGPVPAEPTYAPTSGNKVSQPMVQELGAAVEQLTAHISRLRNGASRLHPIA